MLVSSIFITESEPFGITAPVDILIAFPGGRTRSVSSPISIVPIFSIIFGLLGDAPNVSTALIAYPSIALLSKGGISSSLIISVANIRFRALDVSTSSTEVGVL